MKDYLNKIVIMEHSALHDTHVLAKVVKQTKASVVVHYWNPRSNQWNVDSRVRRLLTTNSTIIRIVGDDTLPEDMVARLQDRITSGRAEMERRQRAAKNTYYEMLGEL